MLTVLKYSIKGARERMIYLDLCPALVVHFRVMNDSISSLDPSNISAPRARARMNPGIPVSASPASGLSRLSPRESKYSLRLGDIERAQAEKVASEKGISLADFVRFAVHTAIQQHNEAHRGDNRDGLKAQVEPDSTPEYELSAVSTSQDGI